MIAHAQPQYITVQEIIHWEMESTDYNNIESNKEVGTDPVTCHTLTTLTIYDPTKEFPELVMGVLIAYERTVGWWIIFRE